MENSREGLQFLINLWLYYRNDVKTQTPPLVFIKTLDCESLQTVFNVIRAWVKSSLDNIEYSMVNQVN